MVCTVAMFTESCEGAIIWKPSCINSRRGTLCSTATTLTCRSCNIEWRTSQPMDPKVISPGRKLLRVFSK
jgi:hypothetical protein